MKGRKQVQTSQSPAGGKGAAKLSMPSQAKRSSHGLANPSFRKTSQLMASKSMMESKARLHAASRGPRRRDEDGFRDGDYDDNEGDYLGPRELIKPPDQLELTEQELKEELTRVLTADNPHAPANIVRYNFKEQTFKQIAAIDQLAIHFAMDSNLLHKESDEARRQLAQLEGAESSESESEGEEEQGEADKEEGEDGGEGDSPADGESKKKSGKPVKRLRNQFNFSERASQTLNNPYRDRGTATEPPPRADFSGTANQMEIFDAYVQDLIAQDKAKEKKTGGGTKGGASGGQEEEKRKGTSSELQSDDLGRVSRASKIMERMVNQNTFDDIAQDFKYYEDAGDEFRDITGLLLPLWRFKYEKARKSAVTALSWNPLYKDLFAVGHGSYDFTGQPTGIICLHSLKNPTFPEYIFSLSSGVMCLDIHPEHPFLLAVGLYDGTVAVYDFREGPNNPIYKSTARAGKHTDPVWQVCWQNNDMDGNMNFYSVSSDGRVVMWKLVKNELQYQDAVQLKIPGASVDGPEGIQQQALSSGTAIGFNPFNDHLFLVGTEEGQIYKCSKAYTSHYLDMYQAHHMAVHAIRWNPFHQSVFASCGADWTVKIWDHTRKDPMFTFDLSNVVGDVAWSPYCATVFAAVTAEGKVYIYDLSINKYEPLCVQTVTQKKNTKLTHVAFNPIHPVLVVGDDRGTVICLKLSPNLRKALKEKTYSKENEVAKMEKLISFVREPLLEKEQGISSS